MPAQPGPSNAYRSPAADEDEDDLDDLDGKHVPPGDLLAQRRGADVLAAFNAPAASSTISPSHSAPHEVSDKRRHPTVFGAKEDEEEDFEASLVEGMESLLRQLAGDHPPGPMPDKKPIFKPDTISDVKPGSRTGGVPDGGADDDLPPSGDLSKEEEEEAWQRAVDMMLSGEGLEALGLDKSSAVATAGEEEEKPETKPDFDETIRRTMESLRSPGTAGASKGDKKPDIEELLKQLGSDPAALDGLGCEDDELGGLLDGMMAQLMTKEVLEEPMAELASKYPSYLSHPPPDLRPSDLQKYQQQHHLVQSILDTFHLPNYSDDKDGKEVARLIGEMQDLGGPPKEIMGELPEGFNLEALGALGGGEEGCVVM